MGKDDQANWNRLVNEGLCYDGQSNTRYPFQVMSKKFGRAFIDYLRAAWQANDGCLSDEEFCQLNGGIPASLFQKTVAAR